MSTPRGKPPNPIALSTHVSHKAHEEAVTEPPRSPYAPKQAQRRAGTERIESDRAPLRSPYAPKQARAQGAALDFAADDSSPVRTPRGLREHTAPYPVKHRGESMGGRDLERLEASLRLLQRQESARLPHATNLARGLRQSSGSDGFRSPRSLEPERLAPAPEMPRRYIGASVGIVVAIILAATIMYYFAVGGWAPSSEPASGPQTASDPTVASPPSWSTGHQAPPPRMVEDDNRATSAQTSQSLKTSQPARSSEGETGAIVQLDEPDAQIPPASKATRVLDLEEITLLMKQGKQFIAAGDVVTARIVFQRAAEAGDADAAVALGANLVPKSRESWLNGSNTAARDS
jgi:hypothetical protein